MHRFFINPNEFQSEVPVIRGADAIHIARVLRLGSGDNFEVLDGNGKGALAQIISIGEPGVSLRFLEEFTPKGEPTIKVTLVQGLGKGEKMDWIVQKSTELGVSEVIPMVCHRSVVHYTDDKAFKKQERWQRIALEAAKQSRRAKIPVVHMPQKMSDVLNNIPKETLAIIPWEEERVNGLQQFLTKADRDSLYIIIGPEGGFEPWEIKQAVEKGVLPITLGARILRTETAGLACIAVVMFTSGDLG